MTGVKHTHTHTHTHKTLDEIKARLDNAKEKINELEDIAIETIQDETQGA